MLIKFDKKEHYEKIVWKELEFTDKVKDKLNIEVLDLKTIVSVYASFCG